ncbi:hypothetical protein CC85DRAFT_303152 [Cutaneotrichosporon oleaginosum]|uniref:DUF1349-domain-containing protein n=1 Tax=Cutaneotrichosporon oleaginosum TaxID=879819 RepID=A0A0J0XK53_9TREE|nr:uncharacterized protein CC85DRAFT_303152 [Cutaneotrichosporon oleaginosum]KLT41471.1 hypothetical protein CC85DRAFT_303152 [Cutaneotrichosporon oleaginosum]TXT05878.1 hypothetical protein COLE_07198 [Cutaneotrichosporon oleaginosum]
MSPSAPPVDVPGLPPLEWGFRPGRAYADAGVLVLLAYASTDWVVDPLGAPPVLSACPLGFAAPQTFSLSARVSVSGARTTFDAPALLVWRDEKHWGKLCFERAPTGSVGPVSVVTDGGTSDDANAYTLEGEEGHMWLRLSRVGVCTFAFHASRDGRWWDFVRIFRLSGGDSGSDQGSESKWRVGFLAQSPTGPGCAARFEDIRLGAAPTNLRDGS